MAMSGLANIYGTEGKYEIALRYARRATEADPGQMSARRVNGTLALELAEASGTWLRGV